MTVGRYGGPGADSTELLLELDCAVFQLHLMRVLLANFRTYSTHIQQVLVICL